MDGKKVILAYDAMVKKVGERSFLLRTSFDYSKQNLIELTEMGKEIVEYIKEMRTFEEVSIIFHLLPKEIL